MTDKHHVSSHWSLLTNHARVLLCLAEDPTMRIRTIAHELAITERSVHMIIADLDHSGYIERRREGRRNTYQLHLDLPLPLPHAVDGCITVRQLFSGLMPSKEIPLGAQRPAVFLDRDSTLIEDLGILDAADPISLSPDTISFLQRLAVKFELFVVTNQRSVTCREPLRKDVNQVNKAIDASLSDAGIIIRHWYVCYHEYSDDPCITANKRFLEEAAYDYNVDLSQSYVIGDHLYQVLTGEEAGCMGLYLLTRYGAKHLREIPKEKLIFHTVQDAVFWIERHPKQKDSLEEEMRRGVRTILQGGLTVFPTETVYGLGADAMNGDAVTKIFTAKERPFQDPLISHVCDREMVVPLVGKLSPKAVQLMDHFWPGPLTLVFPKSERVPDVVTAGNPTVAVRMPNHPLALELIRLAKTPIAAPSANTFGKTSPTTAQHVEDQLAGRFDAMIDGGACRIGVESTVLSLVGETPVLLRLGGVTREEIEEVVGPVLVKTSGDTVVFDSPGLFPSHYATKTPMIMVDDPSSYAHTKDIALMLFTSTDVAYDGMTFILSPEGDAREAAARLYETMRRIDTYDLRLIVAQRLPDSGVGMAVNDRIYRASKKAVR